VVLKHNKLIGQALVDISKVSGGVACYPLNQTYSSHLKFSKLTIDVDFLFQLVVGKKTTPAISEPSVPQAHRRKFRQSLPYLKYFKIY
jgi:hypothetical protein